MESLSHIWPSFVANEIKIWTDFHRFWLSVGVHLPVLPVRYEDLLTDKQDTLTRTVDFMSTSGAPIGFDRYLPKYSPTGAGAPGYKPKQGGIGKGLRLFSEELISVVLKEAKEIMDLFGYHVSNNIDANVKNVTQDLVRKASSHEGQQSQLDKIHKLEILPLIDHSPEEWSQIFKDEVISSSMNGRDPNNNRNDRDFDLNDNEIDNNMNKKVEVTNDFNSTLMTPKPHETNSILGLDIQESLQSSIMINELFSVRKPDDLFGRRMTELRCSYTNDDKTPFETFN
eukprot:CAMPEP_0119043924 /NCGR_PEP_ID=MMETSP1177-20130426/27007_1 /TAXON_ID=2985 /ORGANISM="Ochromonas sp, Strain CCMP1899" /LENGTH=283 /DNA_ID=CAMNT_0007013077 /DNA_START=493 /DNA_END=1344 /DNA_ORIENTATION=-